MQLSFPKFSRLFFTLLLLHLVVLIKEPDSGLLFITKPTLVLSLLLFFFQNGRSNLAYYQILFGAGLVFSLVGDVLLMWDNLFVPGLGAFLIAQLCYSFAFYRSNENKPGFLKKYPIAALPAVMYGIGLSFALYPNLGELAIPVFVYAGVISVMLLMAINRIGNASKESAQFVTLGAILFVLSDSILAFNKFHTPYEWGPAAVMLTYGLAQYFLVWGMRK